MYGFTSRSRIFHLYGDVKIASEGVQNLGLCSALRAFEQGGIFIVPHLLWRGTSGFFFFFLVSSEGPSYLVASYDTRGDVKDLQANPDPHVSLLYTILTSLVWSFSEFLKPFCLQLCIFDNQHQTEHIHELLFKGIGSILFLKNGLKKFCRKKL
jgi:hypothetical protein